MNTTANYDRLTKQVNDTLSLQGKEAWAKVGDLFFGLWSTVPPRYLGHEHVHSGFMLLMEYITIFQNYPTKDNREHVLRVLDNLIRAMKHYDNHAAAAAND